MNYLFLKNIIDATLQNFHCQHCGQGIQDPSLFVTSVGPEFVQMDILCQNCKEKMSLRAELGNIPHELLETAEGKALFYEFLKKVEQTSHQTSQKSIQDADIHEVQEGLHGSQTVEELFGR